MGVCPPLLLRWWYLGILFKTVSVHLTWLALESLRPLSPGWWTLEALPSLDLAKCPRGNSLCTLTTASRERTALRLGFCFQLSSERGSTYRNIPSGTPDPACTNRHELLLAPSVTSEDAGPRPDLGWFPLCYLPNTTKRGWCHPYPFPCCLPCLSHNCQAHLHCWGSEGFTLLPRRAATQASEASQMAVRSCPPSKANTTAPPAKFINCCVMYPKPGWLR